MTTRTPAAHAATCPANLRLPLAVPRASWPDWIDAAARILRAEDCGCAELADELRTIATALRGDGYGELIDALRDCIAADQPMAQMHATESAKAVLRRVGGVA